MTQRELRTRRRAEERKAAKLSRKNQPEPFDHHVTAAGLGFVSQNPSPLAEFAPDARLRANRLNARLSTGPRSPMGKAASRRNSLKHGLATGERIIPGEDPAEFGALLAALQNEYQPATATEELLVTALAESHWFVQRALRLQNACFEPDGIDEKRLALFMRYQTNHQCAFHKALAALTALQKARHKAPHGFVSQSKVPQSKVPQNDSQEAPAPELAANGFVSQPPRETPAQPAVRVPDPRAHAFALPPDHVRASASVAART
jgi:hypothetical protein